MTTPTPEQVEAARELIAAHDELRASYRREPERNAYGWAINSAEWLQWRETDNTPAYNRWKAAADEFDRLTGHSEKHWCMLRHVAEDILRNSALSSGA